MRRFTTLIALITAVMLLSTSFAWGSAAAPDTRHTRVDFADASNGYLSGFYYSGSGNPVGYIARTASGGTQWSAIDVANQAVWGLGVASPSIAWGVMKYDISNRFGVRTADFGANWSATTGKIESVAERAEPYDVTAFSATEALVGGRHNGDTPNGDTAAIWRTTDAGASWSEVYHGPLYPADSEGKIPETTASTVGLDRAGDTVFALVTENEAGGSAVKDNHVLKSTNRGASWSTPVTLAIGRYNNSNSENVASVADISAASANVAWAAGPVGSAGQVFRTVDGSTWTRTTNVPFPVNGIDAYDANRAVVVGEGGKVALTVNGGATWTQWTFSGVNSNNLQSVAFRGGPDAAVAVGDDQLIVLVAFDTTGATPNATGVVKRSTNGNLGPDATVDAIAPTISYSGVAKGAKYTSAVKPVFSATDNVGVTSLSATLNGKTFASGTSITSSGSYSLVITAKDARNNTASETIAFTVAIPATAKPKVSLGTPVAPKTMKKNKSYTVYGSLKPRHTSGSKPVRIYKYKKVKVKGKWTYKSYGYTTAKAYNYSSYSRYKAKIKLTSKGTWRLKAYAPADSKHAATWSSKYDTVTVK